MSDTKKPSHDKFEADFEAFLRDEDSHLAGLYRKLPQPEPDASIDARLRARARQALRESGAQVAQASAPARRRRPRWLPALGAAATFVAVAGVAWRLMPHTSPLPTAATATNGALVTAAAPAKTGDTESSAAAPASPEVSPATPAAEAPAQQASPTVESAQYRHKVHRSLESAPIAPPPAAAAPEDKVSAASDRLSAPAGPASAPAVAAPPTKPESPAAFPRREARAEAENAPQSASTPAAPPAAAKAAAPAAMESARAATTAGYAPAQTASASAAARQQAPGNRLADTEPSSAGDAVQNSPPASIEPDSLAPGRYRWQIAGVAAETATKHNGIYPPDPPPPAIWVDIIHAMLRDGHPDAARRALTDLHRRHPDFRVPADLRNIE